MECIDPKWERCRTLQSELMVGRRVLQGSSRTWSERNWYRLQWQELRWCEDYPSSTVLTLSAPSFQFKLQPELTWTKMASVHFDASDNFFFLMKNTIQYIQTVLFSRPKMSPTLCGVHSETFKLKVKKKMQT